MREKGVKKRKIKKKKKERDCPKGRKIKEGGWEGRKRKQTPV